MPAPLREERSDWVGGCKGIPRAEPGEKLRDVWGEDVQTGMVGRKQQHKAKKKITKSGVGLTQGAPGANVSRIGGLGSSDGEEPDQQPGGERSLLSLAAGGCGDQDTMPPFPCPPHPKSPRRGEKVKFSPRVWCPEWFT